MGTFVDISLCMYVYECTGGCVCRQVCRRTYGCFSVTYTFVNVKI